MVRTCPDNVGLVNVTCGRKNNIPSVEYMVSVYDWNMYYFI